MNKEMFKKALEQCGINVSDFERFYEFVIWNATNDQENNATFYSIEKMKQLVISFETKDKLFEEFDKNPEPVKSAKPAKKKKVESKVKEEPIKVAKTAPKEPLVKDSQVSLFDFKVKIDETAKIDKL